MMLFITFLGNGQTMPCWLNLLRLGQLCSPAAMQRQHSSCCRCWEFTVFSLITLLVARPRPMLEAARIIQGGLSFRAATPPYPATFMNGRVSAGAPAKHDAAKIVIGLVRHS